MSKKKLDLFEMYEDTGKAYDRHNISTSQAQDTENKPLEKYAAYRQAEESSNTKASTKPKRTNMAFSDDLYEKIFRESERLSVSLAYYINTVIRQADQEKVRLYYEAQPVKTSKACIPRKKGKPSKRITLKIDPDVYDIITAGATRYDQTITQYANLVLEASI